MPITVNFLGFSRCLGRATTASASVLVACVFIALSMPTQAARVQFQTFLGNFEADVFDQQTPVASAAFLSLVSEGVYNDSVIHRIENGTLMQGGRFVLDGDVLVTITEPGVSRSEVLFSNVRGTLAFADPAELSTGARSVQWFINLDDNSAILDDQNGGYTVFGRVTNSGMAVVDAIAKLERLDFQDFPDLPLRNYGMQDALNGEPIKHDNYAVVEAIVTLDSGSDPNLVLPPLITQVRASPTPAPETNNNDEPIEGIGAVDLGGLIYLTALMLSVMMIRRRSLAVAH